MRRAVIFVFFTTSITAQNADSELNTALMHATFRIQGAQANSPARISFGTVFFVGRPMKDKPGESYQVMVTAKHVLDEIGGDTAALLVRKKNEDGTYTAYSQDIRIRDAGKPLYTTHDSADVAVMYMPLPVDVPIALPPVNYLMDDKRSEEWDLHPGDEVFCLGFPLLASGPGGFPILRSGRIASYPLIPTRTIKEIYFAVLLYGGNSGGPVYFYYTNRVVKGHVALGSFHQGILGLVVQQANSTIPEFADKPLNFGVIVPAQFIRETIDKLPSLDK